MSVYNPKKYVEYTRDNNLEAMAGIINELDNNSKMIVISVACEVGFHEIAQLFLSNTNFEYHETDFLTLAAGSGNLKTVELMLPYCDPLYANSLALIVAAENGYLEIVKLLLPVSEPRSFQSRALTLACKNGHLDVANELIPVSKCFDDYCQSLNISIGNGHTDIAKALISNNKYGTRATQAMLIAAEKNNIEIMDLLYYEADMKYAELIIRDENSKTSGQYYLLDMVAMRRAQFTKNAISLEIENNKESKPKNKI